VQALGFVEVSGVVAAVDALDVLCKSANVRFVTWERKLGGRLVTVIVEGSVSDVTEAIETAKAHCVSPIRASNVIANPHPETVRLVELSASRLAPKNDPEPPTATPEPPAPAAEPAPEEATVKAEAKPTESAPRAPRKSSRSASAAAPAATKAESAPEAEKPAPRKRTPSKELSQDALAAALAHALGKTGGKNK
jgi:microcompartment protein CcmL/EutN